MVTMPSTFARRGTFDLTIDSKDPPSFSVTAVDSSSRSKRRHFSMYSFPFCLIPESSPPVVVLTEHAIPDVNDAVDDMLFDAQFVLFLQADHASDFAQPG